MAKLTRTSKFADLRGQITNDRESSVVTNDLSAYQNRLNNVQGQLDPRMQEQMNNTQSFNNYNNNYQQPQYTTAQFEQPQQTFNNLNMNNNSYNDFNNNYQQPQQPQYTAEQFIQPQQTFNNLNVNDSSYGNVGNNYQQPQESVNNTMNKTLTIDDIYNDVFSQMNQGQNNVGSNTVNNDYMEQTFSGVNSYNMNNGQQTLNDILESNVDAVRHQQQPQKSYQYQQQPVNQQPLNSVDNSYQANPQLDKEFSNTVSLEISKIMDGIDNNKVGNQQPVIKPQQPQTQENVVDIKNIRDTEPVTRDTISETIPFVVSDQDVDEYDEEEGSNTVLNIILIVLIVILLAVLGMIVFYILKTKGIL